MTATKFMKWSAWLIMSAIVGYGGSVILGQGQSAVRNLGDVEAGTRISTSFDIANGTSAPLLLGGFEDACGISASVTGNGILSPGETGKLTLAGTAARRRGPGGAAFELVQTSAGKRKTTNYQLIWNVVGTPWITPTELWIANGEGWIEVKNARRDVEIRNILASEGITASPAGAKLKVAIAPGLLAGRLCNIEFDVISGGDKKHFKVPLYVKSPIVMARLYPGFRLINRHVARDEPILQVIGTPPADVRVVATGGLRDSVRMEGDKIVVRSNVLIAPGQECLVELRVASGAVIASARLRGGR